MQKLFENFRKFLNEAPKEDNYETELAALKKKMKDSPQRYIKTYDGDVLDLKYNPDTMGFDEWIEDGWKWFGDRELVFRWYPKANEISFNFNEIFETIRDPEGKRTKAQLTLSERQQAEAYLKQKFDAWFKTNGPTVGAVKEANRTRDLINHYLKEYEMHIPAPSNTTKSQSGLAHKVFKDLQKEIKRSQGYGGADFRRDLIKKAVANWFEYAKYSELHARQNLPRRPSNLSYLMADWLASQLILDSEFARHQPYPYWDPKGQNARKVAEKVAGYYRDALDDPRMASRLERELADKGKLPELEGLSDEEQKRFYKRISDSFPTAEDPGTLIRIYQKIYHDPYTAMRKIVTPNAPAGTRGLSYPQEIRPLQIAWREVVSQRDGGWNKLSEEQQKELIDRMVAIEMDKTYRLTAGKNPIIKDFEELLVHVKSQAETPLDIENALKFIDKQSTELATLDKKASKSWFRNFLRKLPFFSAGFVGVLFPYDEAQAAFNRGILRKQGVLEPWRPEGRQDTQGGGSLQDLVEEAAQLSRFLFGDANDPQAEFKTLLLVESFRAFDPGLELLEVSGDGLMALVNWTAKKTPPAATKFLTKTLSNILEPRGPASGEPLDRTGVAAPGPPMDLLEMKIIFKNWRKWK